MEVIKPIIALVGGGAAGYITNDYAVKMLFRKYGPFGGMIIETREQFVESMSKLVERDIINNHTIENELSKHEFRRVFYNLVSDVLKTHLYNNTADIDIIKIPGMRDSINNFVGFYKENVSELAGDFFKSLLDNIQLEDVLGEKQRVFLADKLWEILLNELTENDAIENIINGFYRENKEKPLDEWINPKLFKAVALNMTACTSNLHETLQSDFNDEIDELIKNMYVKLDCDGILKRFENNIKDKTLMEILGKKSAENIANEILERGIKLLKSPEGKELIHNFSIKIFDILKSINVSVLSILDDGIRSKLEGYMRDNLPIIIEKIIYWIKSNKTEIDNLINRSIDDVLEDGSSGFFDFRGKAKKALKNSFYENIAGNFEIVKYIIAYIEQGTDVRSMSIEVTNAIIAYIGKNTVSQIITDLEKKKILRPEYIASLINNNIDTQISKMNISMFDAFFQNRVGDIVKSNFSHHFEIFIKNTLIDQLKNKFLFSSKGTKILQREVGNKIIELGTEKIGKVISDDSCEDLAKFSKDKIITELTTTKTKMISLLAKGIQDEIGGKYIGSFCNDDMIQKMGKIVADKSLYYLREKISDGQNQPIKEVYDHLNAQKDSVKNLTGLVIELSNKNLHLLLEGKIQETVSTNLSKLPDAEIQSIVENFMGKELKPINLFGAILGSTAGLSTYLLESGLQIAKNPVTELAFTVAVYGFVGYITNVIALKMIFQPYYEKKLMGVKVPFTPGVVTKQKPRFAASMGEFVDQSLLKASAVNEIFQDKRSIIESSFIETISADDYKLLQQVLVDNNELISRKVLSMTLQFIDKNKEVFFDNMVGELKDVNLAKFDYTTLQFAIQDKSHTYIKNTNDVISEQLNKILQSGKSLNATLPDSVKKAMYDSVNQMLDEKIQGMIEVINDDSKIKKIVADFAKSFDVLVEKNIDEQLTKEETANVKDVVSNYFVKKTQSKEVREALLNWVDEKIGKELTPEKRIGDLFGGMLIRILHQNAEFILDSIIGAAQARLQNNHDSIKREVYTMFRQGSGTKGAIGDFLLDIESSIYSVIDDLVDRQLPSYISRKEHELKEILTDFIDVKVARSRIADMGIEMNSSGIINIVDRLLQSKQAAGGLKQLSDSLVASILKVPIKKLLHVASVNNIFDIYKVFAVEIKDFRSELTTNIMDKQPMLVDEVGLLVKSIIEKILLPLPVQQLTGGISQDDVDKTVKKIVVAVGDSKIFASQLEIYSKNIIGEIKYKELHELVDVTMAKQDSMVAFSKIVVDEQVKANLERALKDVLTVLLANINNIVTADTKNFTLDIIVKSLLDSLEQHLLHVINAVNIKQVTEREINHMEPKEIEDMFNSFAKPYFRKIEAYGWIGGGIGVVTNVAEKVLNVIIK